MIGVRCVQSYSFTWLGLEDRWAWHQGFTEVVVVIGTFKGVSNGGFAWSLWSDLYLSMVVPHLTNKYSSQCEGKGNSKEIVHTNDSL